MRQASIVTDISYGDAGKGTTVDYLVRQAASAVVVRYNGGPQAAHNVVTPDGRHHTFAQFGSGTLVPGVKTHLSSHMLVNPLNMFNEAEHLTGVGVHDAWERLSVDGQAIIITPWYQTANRLREIARGDSRHGSCGQGVGETRADAISSPDSVIRVKDLLNPARLVDQLEHQRASKYAQLFDEIGSSTARLVPELWETFTDPELIAWLCERYAYWTKLVRISDMAYLKQLATTHEQLVFEGSQGVLLDESHGFYPYTTWTDTTPRNALDILSDIGYTEPVKKLGIMRAYTTRHGAGPFVTEDLSLSRPLREIHNEAGQWQGNFRFGHLDLVAHRYAIEACQGIDELVITGLDRLMAVSSWRYADAYHGHDLLADAADYLDITDGDIVARLKPGPVTPTCGYQARLTEQLVKCSPRYRSLSAVNGYDARERQLRAVIEAHLGAPVTLISRGPSAVDKDALVHC